MDNKKKKEIVKKIYEELEKDANTPNSKLFHAILIEILHYALYENNERDFNPAKYKTVKDYLAKPIDSTQTEFGTETIRDKIVDYILSIFILFIQEYAEEFDLSEREVEKMLIEAMDNFVSKYGILPSEKIISDIEKLPFEEVFNKFKEEAEILHEILISYHNQLINLSLVNGLVRSLAQQRKIDKFNMSNLNALKEIIQVALEEFSTSKVMDYISSEFFKAIASNKVRDEIMKYVKSLIN